MASKSPALVVFALLAAATVGPVPARGQAPTANRSVSIAAIVPNPVADGDAGEFVVLQSNESVSLTNWSLADDDQRVDLPNVTVTGRLVLSTAPNRTRNLTAGPVAALPDEIALANSGEHVTLSHDGVVVDTLTYSDAPEGEIGRPSPAGLRWRAIGATDFPVVAADGGSVRAFVLPDGRNVPDELLSSADDRILLAGYTLTSRRVVDELRTAADRGVTVRVLVDGSPVGGLTRREASALDRLVAANVSVTVMGGDRARYDFHHAKYAVADDRALVTTENWKPAGTGGHSSRGWGVIVHDETVVRGLVRTFETDSGWRSSRTWSRVRRHHAFEPAHAPPANATYPSRFEPQRFEADHIALLRAPDNAERRLIGLLDNATDSIRVEQMYIGSRHQPFLQASLRAARRGVRVRILLSSAWYVEKDNRRLVQWLNERAAREHLPLKARMVHPHGRFEKVHAKGVVVDGDQVIVGSMNWNNHSARQNREVALLVTGDEVGEYYTNAFRADWHGGRWRLLVGLAVAVVLGGLLAGLLGRRIEFEGEQARRRS